MREISAVATRRPSFGAEKNPPIFVYDTLGPVHRPGGEDRHPLGPCRRCAQRWIEERDDTERARRPDLALRAGAPRRSEARRAALRPAAQAAPRASRAERHADALRAPRHHHAGDGIHRDPREPAARSDARATAGVGHAPACRAKLRRRDPETHHARVRARRSRARPRDHPDQHQPPGNRADDHRPQLPGEDQRQHRQLRGDARASTKKWRR